MEVSVFLLAMARFTPLLMVPAFTPFAWVPSSVRVVVLLALTLMAVGAGITPTMQLGLDEPLPFVMSLLSESLLGLSLSLAVVLPAAALGFSARIVDMQSGVAAASLLNPSTHTVESLAGTVVQWAGMMVFFTLGLHVVLLQGLVASIEIVPLGEGGWLLSPGIFMSMLSSQFLLGLMVVAPVILGLFAIDLAMAYASRSMPQANIYFVSLPLKVLASFTLLAVSLRFAPLMIERLYRNAFSSLSVLGGH
ncbi:type III secretion protein [Dyella tabacisoli]|uniref:Type III secretion protein n=2 Tax=Dyella tabacisoli TaxID=2282381 RepID=A0A369UMW3_9GAMM|nr:type III secretion protein [Dyella tabacisoli]